VIHVLRWNAGMKAVMAKNRDIPTRDRQRELLDPPTEADVKRRCHVMPQVWRVGLAKAE
jgi:hypothetical protein